MSWRTIPPELGVPTVMAALIDVVGLVMPAGQGPPVLALATGVTRDLLLAYGLLELRRRQAQRGAPLLAVGAALQCVVALGSITTTAIAAVSARGEQIAMWTALSYVSSGAGVAFTVAMIAATRAWRSPIGPIALLTSLAWRMPLSLGALVYSHLSSRLQIQLFFLLAMLAAQVALLGLFARLEDAPAPADPARAERGARRVARSLRLRAGLTIAVAATVTAMAVHGRSAWLLLLIGALAIAALLVIAGQIAGLLTMATARLAILASPALHAAGFAALWEALLNTAVLGLNRGRAATALAVMQAVIGAAGMGFAAAAIRGVAGLRRDRELRAAIATRIGWILALQIMNAASIGLIHPRQAASAVLLAAFCQALQLVALLLLAGLYARVAERIPIRAAADVF